MPRRWLTAPVVCAFCTVALGTACDSGQRRREPIGANEDTTKRQLLAPEVLGWLKMRLPDDAFGLVAVTMEDLYPEPSWNFVFGMASLTERVGVQSFARQDPAFFGESRPAGWQTLAQDLEGTGVTVNALLPGGATLTGMVPQSVPEQTKSALLDPSIIVPPLLWLVSTEADTMTGRRLVATKWQTGSDGRSAAEAATEQAGWGR